MTEIYCSKCGQKNAFTENYCVKCGKILRKPNDYKIGAKITSFEDMFTQKRKEQLEEIPLTDDIYELILTNIYEIGKKSIKKDGTTALEKVTDVVEAYAKWSYKSKGGELGFYTANNIKLDDRLNESSQIATLIHELSHHLLAEIFEQILMYYWKVKKTYELEVFVQYVLGSGTIRLMNEYCAHTVEGRFIPHGYQNYGSFNSILEDKKDEFDHDIVFVSLVLGNTIAEDLIHLLEHFIDEKLRQEIKQQYNKDQLPPSYSQIGMETTDMLDSKSRNTLIMDTCIATFDKAMESPDFKNMLNEFLETFKAYNQ
ncbi:zinc ribbon domain-containing protein [uncultured Methanobrevibacter sp.]|uniref:zinc ribbon domain-containing protein n=1 Tax=uncultured Methanobrevibacter sp. TaxID=253161 RepID=UPI002618790E|nr:zinc ribbon domain-containing protein [uncultured Methanobrevibacter sp.]